MASVPYLTMPFDQGEPFVLAREWEIPSALWGAFRLIENLDGLVNQADEAGLADLFTDRRFPERYAAPETIVGADRLEQFSQLAKSFLQGLSGRLYFRYRADAGADVLWGRIDLCAAQFRFDPRFGDFGSEALTEGTYFLVLYAL
jgi:hypothetical protein